MLKSKRPLWGGNKHACIRKWISPA